MLQILKPASPRFEVQSWDEHCSSCIKRLVGDTRILRGRKSSSIAFAVPPKDSVQQFLWNIIYLVPIHLCGLLRCPARLALKGTWGRIHRIFNGIVGLIAT
jgi:hypothetical protein